MRLKVCNSLKIYYYRSWNFELTSRLQGIHAISVLFDCSEMAGPFFDRHIGL